MGSTATVMAKTTPRVSVPGHSRGGEHIECVGDDSDLVDMVWPVRRESDVAVGVGRRHAVLCEMS